jgi:DNA-binding SARP family transcriptional activator
VATVARPESAAPAGIELCLLGAPALRMQARSVALSPKDAALLCLAARAAPIRAERVAALLWPQATGRQADTSLRQRLYRLRRELGSPLVASGALLVLAPGVRTDLAAALQALDTDEHAAEGELLGDLSFEDLPDLAEWLRAERARWRAERQTALAAVAERCEKEGALARALVYAKRHADGEPLAEHAQRRLMRLHYLRGDRAAAIAAFEGFERRLKDELGARPSAETLELLATVERGAASLPARRAVAPASLLRPPRLIGREPEWRALGEAWALGRAFVVVGDAGIGKSRLVGDFVAGEPGSVIVKVRAGDTQLPDAVLARLARAVLAACPDAVPRSRRAELALLLPELGPATEASGAARRVLLQRAFEAMLVGATDAGLRALVIDDLHGADDASVELLRALWLWASEALPSLRWGFAQRAAEGGPGVAALRAALDDAQGAQVVGLAPLTEPQLAQFVASLDVSGLDPQRLAAALLRQGGGNPLFAIETLRDLVLGAAASVGPDGALPRPAGVTALVERRLMQLSAPALRLARLAALAGDAFDVELAAAVLEAHPLDMAEPWRELEAAQVIRDGGFAHDLVFEATRASVPQPIAQSMHERIARHLAARGAEPAQVAPHWAGAARWREAGVAYAAAARRAQAASLRAHEVDDWQRAAEAFDRAGARADAFQARCDSVPALIVVQGVAPARALAGALVDAAQGDAERAAAWIATALAALMAGDHAQGIAAASEAATLARALDSGPLALEAACLQAVGLTQAGRPAEGLAIIEPRRAAAERADTAPRLRGRFWSDYAYALNGVRRLRDTAFALEQAIANAQSLGDLAEQATLTSNLATVKGNLGHVDEALALAQRALVLQDELGATEGPEGGVVHTYVGLYCGALGRYTEALEHLDLALARFARDRQTLWIAIAANHKAQLMMDLGQWARARQALEYEAPSVTWVRARRTILAARIERALGEAGAGLALQEAQQTLAGGDDPHVRMHLALDLALHQPAADAQQRCDEVERWAAGLEFAGVAQKARLRGAQARVRAGQTAAAAQVVREAVAQLDALPPADLYRGEAWWIAAEVFDANGDGDDALMALARGAQWVRRVALPNVPEPYRDSFLQRNPSNRALLAAAQRRLAST